jgi:pyruvate/2-oxoacid:ferredoxin oxidoreductase beta subunit/Pyruvate/2-oxoacid:ferredoxin oxidoreductase gamma subunit
MSDAVGSLPFCPGCGHTALLESLNEALVRLRLDPSQVVIVTDIGCIGLADRYFTTSAFHGLHGRSITYATGMKLARPELTVIVLMGDGGCGIGAAHLLSAARRNVGMALIVANNFNYGMTGGQHSVTTPSEGITPTTPGGNVEAPLDLCATVGATGGSWVHRATTFDRDLPERIAEAIREPGFAMLDVLELCTAYYVPRNELRKRDLLAMAAGVGLELGRQVGRPRPEFTESYRSRFRVGTQAIDGGRRIVRRFDHGVSRQTGIVVAGSAGRKVRSTVRLFAEGAMFAGLHATQKDDYPITIQTGHSISEIIVSPVRIDYTGIDAPDYFIVLSEEGLQRSREQIGQLQRSCLLYADESLTLPETQATVRRLPLGAAGGQRGKLAASATALAVLLEESGLFPTQALETAIREFQEPSAAELNLKAIRAARRLAERESARDTAG